MGLRVAKVQISFELTKKREKAFASGCHHKTPTLNWQVQIQYRSANFDIESMQIAQVITEVIANVNHRWIFNIGYKIDNVSPVDSNLWKHDGKNKRPP